MVSEYILELEESIAERVKELLPGTELRIYGSEYGVRTISARLQFVAQMPVTDAVIEDPLYRSALVNQVGDQLVDTMKRILKETVDNFGSR